MLVRPFDRGVWYCLLTSLVVLPLAIWSTSNVEQSIGLDAHYWANFVNCTIYVFGTLMGEIIRTKSYFGDSWASR